MTAAGAENEATTQLEFELPKDLEAHEPPEARGMQRDEVRLLVSHTGDNRIEHVNFRDIAQVLSPGDVLVINTSGTINAAIPALRSDGLNLELHLSTCLPDDTWTIELRQPSKAGSEPFRQVHVHDSLALAGGAIARVDRPYNCGCHGRETTDPGRLWIATIERSGPDGRSGVLGRAEVIDYFAIHGFPIRYSYVNHPWPLEYYQTVYADEPGSAEMPSAGRGFSEPVIQSLVARDVILAPLVLHTGVASLESHEPPYEEYFRIPQESVNKLRDARRRGSRVVAVGTTVVRALETAADSSGGIHASEGWTCHVVGPDAPIRSVDGLLSGLHEPKSSHLALLEGLAARDHLGRVYRAAIQKRYKWHEFGDLHLMLP